MGPVAGDAVNPSLGAWPRHPCRGHPRNRTHFFHAMLDQGVFLAPSAYEAGFLSSAHDDAVIEATLAAARVAFKAAKG